MKTIWKYQLQYNIINLIKIPKNGKILSFRLQTKIPTIWVLVNSEEILEERKFKMYGTGFQITPSNVEYIDTVENSCKDIWHLFEIKE